MIKEKFNLANKVAIVTGASKGIGEAMARGLAEFGAKVVISSRKQEAVDNVASDFNSLTRRSAQAMILWLEQRKKLCKTTFRYLEPIVRREISIHNRDLYTFKVAVKKEYQQYLK